MKIKLYQKIVKTITEYLAEELDISPKKKDRIRFGLEIFLSTVITLIFSLLPAFFFNTAKAVIIILLAGGFLKLLTGGIHMKGPWECAVFTSIFVNIFGLITTNYYNLFYRYWPIFILISYIYLFISLFLWSPADVPEKPITDERKIKLFKTTSIIFSLLLLTLASFLFYFTGSDFAIICTGIILGLDFQALTISPLFYKIQNYYYVLKNDSA